MDVFQNNIFTLILEKELSTVTKHKLYPIFLDHKKASLLLNISEGSLAMTVIHSHLLVYPPYLPSAGWFFVWFFFFSVFLERHLWHMEVPRIGVESELQPTAYTTAITMGDPSCICNLHRSSWQCRILNPLSEARDQNCVLGSSRRGAVVNESD